LNAADYSAAVTLRDGRRAEVRALKASDEADFIAAVRRIGAPSLYKRFFGPKQEFSAAEIAFFVNVVVQPGTAELAFAVVDDYQGRGVGTALMCHLIALARNAGLKELAADVLSDNIAMMTVFQGSGLRRSTSRRGRFVRVTLSL